MGRITEGVGLKGQIDYPPSEYAMQLLRKRKCLEMAYFTKENRKRVYNSGRNKNETPMSFMIDGSGLWLQAGDPGRPMKGIAEDKDLTLVQFTSAQAPLLDAMGKTSYSPEAIHSLAKCFANMMTLRVRDNNFGHEAIMKHFSIARKRWHEQLQTESCFDISVIDEAEVERIRQELECEAHYARQDTVLKP